MKIVSKNFEQTKNIPFDIIDAIKKEVGSNNRELQSKTRDFLMRAKETGQWIYCDCNSYPFTIMTICQIKDRSLYLRKIPRCRLEHKVKCPFFREPSNSSTQKNEYVRVKKSFEYFGLYKKTSAASKNHDIEKENSSSKSSSHKIGTLGNRLLTLLEESRLNVFEDQFISENEGQFISYFKKYITNEIKTHNVVKDVKLEKAFYFSEKFNFFVLYNIYENLKKLQWSWPESFYLHGFILFVSSNVFKSEKVDVKNGLLLSNKKVLNNSSTTNYINGYVTENSGPFLVLMSIKENPACDKGFEAYQVFATPILSETIPIPVESKYERYVFEALIFLFKELKRLNNHIKIDITKPLYDYHFDGETCRPDFIISVNDYHIVIEVMGMDDDAYKRRKIETHGIMRNNIGNVIEINCSGIKKSEEFDKLLNKIIVEIQEDIPKEFKLEKYKNIFRTKNFHEE